MCHFSRYGIADCLITDNGPQFSSSPLATFACQWSFKHVNSSPHYPRSNGKAESAVKVAKSLLKKCKTDNTNVWLAILEWQNSPTEGIASSLAQRLMSQCTRTYLPTTSTLLLPQVIPDVQNRLIHKRKVAKQHYDRGTKQLPELVIGQPVLIRSVPDDLSSQWSTGVCLGQVGPQSYEVRTKDRILRRNRHMIMDASDIKTSDVVPYLTPAVPANT